MVDDQDVVIVVGTLRRYVDSIGIGVIVSDARVEEVARLVLQDLDDAHSGTVI